MCRTPHPLSAFTQPTLLLSPHIFAGQSPLSKDVICGWSSSMNTLTPSHMHLVMMGVQRVPAMYDSARIGSAPSTRYASHLARNKFCNFLVRENNEAMN